MNTVMSSYKRVNYYELCRLCTSTEGTKIHIFKEDGRRRQLPTKIRMCLPLKVQESDLLPKMICSNCVAKLEEIENFRNLCTEAEKMLQDFRNKLRPSANESTDKLQVYVKDSASHAIVPVRKQSLTKTQTRNQEQVFQCTSGENKKPVITVMSVTNRMDEETGGVPVSVQCSVPLKVNGLQSSVLPVNDDNLSSLVQIPPESEISRIPKFSIPSQSEMTVVNDSYNQRFNIQSIEKEATNVIQSLQCAVTNNGNIKMPIQTSGPSAISFDSTAMTVSLIPVPHSTISQNENVQEVVMRVNMKNDVLKMYQNQSEMSNGSMELVPSSGSTISHSSCSTSVIQSNPVVYVNSKSSKWQYNEQFNCDTCGKPFRKKEHLFQHRKLHTGLRPFVCGSCGKSFSRKEHLFRHTLAHTGEKRHQCNLCGKTFSRKDNLHKHGRTHGITGPYECELCGKSFIVKHYFLMHQASHSTSNNEELPFQCNICKKGFVKEVFLNTHKVRHKVRINRKPIVEPFSPEKMITSNGVSIQVNEHSLSTINPEDILSSSVVQENVCPEETIYISTQPTTFTLTTATPNTTTTQTTLVTAHLSNDGQLVESYRHVSSATAVSS